MSQPDQQPAPAAEAAAEAKPRRPMPAWKKTVLGLSLVMMATGLAFRGCGALHSPPADGPTAAPGARPLVQSMPAQDDPGGESAADQGSSEWSGPVFRLGFSFFVGFCIAYALRSFLKLALVAIGLGLLMLLGLQYWGVIDVDFTALQQHYQTVAAWIARQTASLRGFITGYLPSSASGALGLAAGFKKH